MVTTDGLSCSAMSTNEPAPAGAVAFMVGVAATRPGAGADWAGDGVRLPASTRPIIAPTAIARPMVMAANRLVMWDGIVKAAARPLSRNQLPERVFVEHRDAERLGFVRLAARVGASHHRGGLLADRAGHLAAEPLDRLGGVLARHRGQGTGQDVGLARQRARRGRPGTFGVGGLQAHPFLAQAPQQLL